MKGAVELMLSKIIKKKNLILIIYAVILLSLWVVALIFGNREDKVTVLVLSLVMPFIIYGLIRLMYKIIGKNCKTMSFFYGFFLLIGSLGTLMMIVEFIRSFPNGLSPSLSALFGLIAANLDSAKKHIENEDNK
jgi:hypothetical protein